MVATQDQQDNGAQHEEEIEAHEAFQYWGYLFQPDKTGSDKLKGLLSGLKDVMNAQYEPSDSPDLTPKQLAAFYRELHGNYEQLFLETPSDSLAFIYKSLGCLHSLQPQEAKEASAQGQSSKFADPTVPALKTEGWIIWQTIQLLLAPEEHSGFLMEAVQKWDVKDPVTGEVYPKILPRRCFPMQPDTHMVAWYEGVSERLRREAEEDERQREMEARHADVRRIMDRRRDPDEEGSVDSKAFARTYFADPLNQKNGKPSIVRRGSKRPTLSPRPTMRDKGKGAATTMGHVIMNIGSPHLWEGRTPNKSHSRDRRRRSLPENKYFNDEAPNSAGHDSRTSPGWDRHQPPHHHRQPSIQMERPSTSSTDDTWNSSDAEEHHHKHQHHREDPELRHSRSHEPTPSQKEYGDYFQGFDDPNRRRNSAYDNSTPPIQSNGIGPGFAPSASPLFMSHLARQPQPQQPLRMPQPSDQYAGGPPPRKSSSLRRPPARPYSRSPDPSLRPPDKRRYSSQSRERRHHGSRSPHRQHGSRSPHRHHDSRSPHRGPYNDSPAPSSAGPHQQPGFPPPGRGPPRDPRDMPAPVPMGGYPPPGGMPMRDQRGSGSRISGSEGGGYDSREDQRSPPPGPPPPGAKKQTRFASGVDGRVYPNEGGWR